MGDLRYDVTLTLSWLNLNLVSKWWTFVSWFQNPFRDRIVTKRTQNSGMWALRYGVTLILSWFNLSLYTLHYGGEQVPSNFKISRKFLHADGQAGRPTSIVSKALCYHNIWGICCIIVIHKSQVSHEIYLNYPEELISRLLVVPTVSGGEDFKGSGPFVSVEVTEFVHQLVRRCNVRYLNALQYTGACVWLLFL